MKPPCTSFHPENGLNVELSLIHPEFCKRLLASIIILSAMLSTRGHLASLSFLQFDEDLFQRIASGPTVHAHRIIYQNKEPLAKLMSGDRLPHFGPFPG